MSALLLKEAGFQVKGIFMKNWTNTAPNIECTSEADFKDAEKVCDQLDIPLHQANFSGEYWEKVFESFLSDHNKGLTPNPDILCNKEIKFRAFLDYCIDSGADYIATGHYVRTEIIEEKSLLFRGCDSQKDQSYFLHQVTGKDLSKALFYKVDDTSPSRPWFVEDLDLLLFIYLDGLQDQLDAPADVGDQHDAGRTTLCRHV